MILTMLSDLLCARGCPRPGPGQVKGRREVGWRWGLWWTGEGWPRLCSSQWPSCVHVGLVWPDLQIVLVKWEIQSVIQSLVLQRLVAIFFFFPFFKF